MRCSCSRPMIAYSARHWSTSCWYGGSTKNASIAASFICDTSRLAAVLLLGRVHLPDQIGQGGLIEHRTQCPLRTWRLIIRKQPITWSQQLRCELSMPARSLMAMFVMHCVAVKFRTMFRRTLAARRHRAVVALAIV
jgi:hypothetical protein